MSERVQVLIVDDQPRARRSLKALLATWPLIGEMQEATNGQEAIQSIEQALPDLVLMDVRMPVLDGLQATRHIKGRWPQIKIIVLSMYGDYQGEALAAGADAFMGKGESPENMLDRIAQVLDQRQHVPRALRPPVFRPGFHPFGLARAEEIQRHRVNARAVIVQIASMAG